MERRHSRWTTGFLSGLVEACAIVQIGCFCCRVFNNEELTSTAMAAQGVAGQCGLRRAAFHCRATSNYSLISGAQGIGLTSSSPGRVQHEAGFKDDYAGSSSQGSACAPFAFPLVPWASVLGIRWSLEHHSLACNRLSPDII